MSLARIASLIPGDVPRLPLGLLPQGVDRRGDVHRVHLIAARVDDGEQRVDAASVREVSVQSDVLLGRARRVRTLRRRVAFASSIHPSRVSSDRPAVRAGLAPAPIAVGAIALGSDPRPPAVARRGPPSEFPDRTAGFDAGGTRCDDAPAAERGWIREDGPRRVRMRRGGRSRPQKRAERFDAPPHWRPPRAR